MRASNLLQLNRARQAIRLGRRAIKFRRNPPKTGTEGSDMYQRQFYTEKQDTKTIALTCPACRKEDNYPIRWIVRTKKSELPRGAGEQDKKRFSLARPYMVRSDELVSCRNSR